MKKRPEKRLKEVLTAVLWMYQNGLRWCQNYSWLDTNGYPLIGFPNRVCDACITGAICLVNVSSVLVQERAELHIRRTGGLDDIPSWNDSRGRTKADIIRLLKKAIKKAPK